MCLRRKCNPRNRKGLMSGVRVLDETVCFVLDLIPKGNDYITIAKIVRL